MKPPLLSQIGDSLDMLITSTNYFTSTSALLKIYFMKIVSQPSASDWFNVQVCWPIREESCAASAE